MAKKRILLADDHKIVLEGLKTILQPEFDLVGIVYDGRELVDEALKLDPDIIVVDISMPRLNGIEAAREINHRNSSIKIIFLTMHLDASYAAMAFDAGASGYVLKNSASRELLLAIKEVLRGGTYITPKIAGELMHSIKKSPETRSPQDHKLTPRQGEVLRLLADGFSAKQIAYKLNISRRTAETHKYNIMQAFNLDTTADLIKLAVKLGITSL